MPAFALVTRPRLAYAAASPPSRRSPTDPLAWTHGAPTMRRLVSESRSFGVWLEPRYIFRAHPLDQ